MESKRKQLSPASRSAAATTVSFNPAQHDPRAQRIPANWSSVRDTFFAATIVSRVVTKSLSLFRHHKNMLPLDVTLP